MFKQLHSLFSCFYSWIIKRPRSLSYLIHHKELYKAESYYPERRLYKRSTLLSFWDQCRTIIKYGTPNKYYFSYGFDVKSYKEQKEYVHFDHFFRRICSLNQSSKINCCCILRDKILFNIFANGIGINTPHNILYSTNGKLYAFDTRKELAKEDLIKFEGKSFFCKLIDGECGNGIFQLTIQDGHLLYNGIEKTPLDIWKILTEGRYLAQSIIKQHPHMSSLHPQSINSLRIITVKSTKDNIVRIFPSILRIGTGKSIVDNTSQGGLCVGIDFKTCKLREYGYYKPQFGRKSSIHPDSGIEFKNFTIPYLREAMEQALLFHSMLPKMHSIGWDIAIGENGPIFIEGNDNWEINGPQICNGGLKRQFESFF